MTLRLLQLGSFLVLSILIGACESQEVDRIGEAQSCINSATKGSVGNCRYLLDGLTSEESYLLRCSIDFISEGFTTQIMAAAFGNLSKSGSNQTSSFMGYLVFSSTTNANTTFDNCNASGEPSYITLASFVKVATLGAATAGLLTGGAIDRNTPIDMTTAINSLISTPSTHATVGSAVQTAYNTQCATPANKTAEYCLKIVSAFESGGTQAEIGQRFLNSLL